MPPASNAPSTTLPAEPVLDTHQTSCCIVGGGPGGCMLALLLARSGVPVTLLEMHKDFDRDFRGDTVHPSTLEILDQIGLAEKVLELPHTKLTRPEVRVGNRSFSTFDLSHLKTKFPFIVLMHQPILLEFLTAQCSRYAHFQLVMQANVLQLVEEAGVVRGVRYQTPQGWYEVRAAVTIGADGRFSRIRQLAGFVPRKTAPPMDVLWFRLPRLPEDPRVPGGAIGGIGYGHLLIVIDRREYWQVGYVILKGSFQETRAAGPDALRQSIVTIEPRLAPHVAHLTDWRQCSLLSVESSRCDRWHKPGLLLIGDAAHVMSPVGGVGINLAIQDAVTAANILTKPLLAGGTSESDLARVQRKRRFPTWFVQTIQSVVQKRFVAGVLRSSGEIQLPWYARLAMRIPIIRNLPARIMTLGFPRVRVQN